MTAQLPDAPPDRPVGRAARSNRLALAVAVWFCALAAFAVWTRQPLLHEGLWTDEAISVYVARAPSVAEFLARNRASDYTPPLFNLLLAGYVRLSGAEETSLKLFALGAGFLAAAAATALAWELAGPLAAAVAAAFLVNNPILVEMSAELRAYSLSAFLAATCLLFAFRLRRRDPPPGRGGYVLLTALLVLLVYSHIAGAMVTVVLFGWGVREWRRSPANPFGRSLAISAFTAGSTFLLWIPTTWRQARIGLPWEKTLTLSENLRAFLFRTREMLPIPQAFEQPVFVVGMAAILGVCVLLAPKVLDGLRRRSEPLVVCVISGGVIWLILGIYTRQSSRYLIIPATLAAVVFASVLSEVLEAAREAPVGLRVAGSVGLAALVVAAFTARAEFYEGRFSVARRPKSGVREVCRARPFERDELVLVVPDHLAPTAWYYCDHEENMRGFANWNRPFLFDPARYRELWSDPEAPALTLTKIQESLAQHGQSRFRLILEETPTGLPPLFQAQVEAFRAELARAYEEKSVGRFPGRIESVRAMVLSRR